MSRTTVYCRFMPYRTGSRKRSFDQQFDWREEKEPAHLHAPRRPRPARYLSEMVGGSSVMECCGAYHCICRCPGCDKPSVTGMVCDVCQIERDIRAQRERDESFEMSELMLAQIRMAGL